MPRKSEANAAQNALTNSAQSQQELLMEGIENFELPKALVVRIAKSALPGDIKLQKDAVLALSKGSTVFINYLAATAQDIARSRSVKTISPADVLKALEIIEFNDQVALMQKELEMYRGKDSKAKDRKKRPAPTKDSIGPPPATRSKLNDSGPNAALEGADQTFTPGTTSGEAEGKGKQKQVATGGPESMDTDSTDPLRVSEENDYDDGMVSRPESRISNVEDDVGYITNEDEQETDGELGQEFDDVVDEDDELPDDDTDMKDPVAPDVKAKVGDLGSTSGQGEMDEDKDD